MLSLSVNPNCPTPPLIGTRRYLGYSILGLSNFFSAWLSYLMLAHPVHTESLLYIVGRADPQCLCFVLMAIITYNRMQERTTPKTWTKKNIHKKIISAGIMLGLRIG